MTERAGQHPPFRSALNALDLPPLSEEAELALRRLRVCLYGLGHVFWVKAALAGYTPGQHQEGVWLSTILAGQRSFGEWRTWRMLRPPRDPDLPEQVATLARFHQRWLSLAQKAAEQVPDPELRLEILDYLAENTRVPSMTWKAKGLAIRIRGLQGIDLYEPAWRALVELGIEGELDAFNAVLTDVQSFIQHAPIDAEEIAEIQQSREDASRHALQWLDARREQLSALSDEDLELLALGELIPPPGFEPPPQVLAAIASQGQG